MSTNGVVRLILISLYKDHQKQFHDTCIKNEKVWGMIQEQLSTQIEKYLKARYIKKRDNEGKIKVQEHHPYLLTIMTNLTISLEIIQMLNL
jgi:hypothetical protein